MPYQALEQPSSIGRLLDSGFKLFVASLKPVLPLIVVAVVTSVIMRYAMFQTLMPPHPFASEEEEALQNLTSKTPQILAISVIMWVVSFTLYNAILARIGHVASSVDANFYDALIVGIKKLFPVFIATLLYFFGLTLVFMPSSLIIEFAATHLQEITADVMYSIVVFLGVLVLLFPGLILMITLLFFQVLIVLNDEGIIASLKLSHKLVWGNYWRTTAVILVPVLISYALIKVVALVVSFFATMTEPEIINGQIQVGFGMIDIAMAAVSVLVLPFLYPFFIVQFNDLKLRKSTNSGTRAHRLNAEQADLKQYKTLRFRLCGTGVGFGLLAVVLTTPIWGIFGPPFISAFSPFFATAFSVAVPIVVFSVVLWKICATRN